MSFIIASDSGCDLPPSYIDKQNIYLFTLSSLLGDHELKDDLGKSYSHKDFYDSLRKGSMPTTSQVNSYTYEKQFTIWAKEQTPVIYLGLSSGLSGSFNSARSALNTVKTTYPDAPIFIIDSLAASGGLGLLVHHACTLREQGISIEKVYDEIEALKTKLVHVFTVDDLFHLERGGRISHASAFVGTLLNIKPVLYVSNEGKLIPHQKCRGRKKALKTLVQYFDQLHINPDLPIMITHGDCLEDAEYVGTLLKESYGVSPHMIHYIGSVIGTHSGPGTIALFFVGSQKTPLD